MRVLLQAVHSRPVAAVKTHSSQLEGQAIQYYDNAAVLACQAMVYPAGHVVMHDPYHKISGTTQAEHWKK